MILLSLLIALAAERTLSSSHWCFSYYYKLYQSFYENTNFLNQFNNSNLGRALFILLPTAFVFILLNIVDNGLLHLIISTLILIICLGCAVTRKAFKKYLQSAFRGEATTTNMYHQQLLDDKNLPKMGFGQALIWLNYRYYIAVMLFFTFFGAAGVVFYRLISAVIENQHCKMVGNERKYEEQIDQSCSIEESVEEQSETNTDSPNIAEGCKSYQDIIFWLDWLPVRITSLGYMFVGHFSKALPVWLDSLYSISKPAHEVLIDVAQKSEDVQVDEGDCTAEPCLLVRLAKRNLLLVLAVISILTLTGIVS